MPTRIFFYLAIACFAIATTTSTRLLAADKPTPTAPITQPDAERLFALKVAPLLKSKCLGCHGEKPDDLKGDLDVRSLAGLLKGGESGDPSLVPGQPEQSLLFSAIKWDGYEMPPKRTTDSPTHKSNWYANGLLPEPLGRVTRNKVNCAKPSGVLKATKMA